MKVAIQQAHGVLASYAGRMGVTNPFYIFTSPEYSFVKSCTGPKGQPVWTLHTSTEKKAILEELRALSGRYKRYLIAPGTLAWCQPRKTALGTRTHDGWNTAPIFYEGKLKHEYDKIFDDGGFSGKTQNVLFQKGTKSQLFSVESMKFGIEICGDFNDGNLSKEARPESLDFEMMLSTTNNHQFSESAIFKVPVKNGGYFIHTDSDKPAYCGAWCVQRGAGSHGVVIPARLNGSTAFDPWTGRMLTGENLGQKLAAGTVLILTSNDAYKRGTVEQRDDLRSSGSAPVLGAMRPRAASLPLPVPPKPAAVKQVAFNLYMQVNPVAPFFDSTVGTYHVEASATLSKADNSGSLANQPVTFAAVNGTLQRPTQFTDAHGVARVVFQGRKTNQPLRMSATFNGVTANCEAKIDSLGAGNVSKIARLQPETVIDLWSYYLPI